MQAFNTGGPSIHRYTDFEVGWHHWVHFMLDMEVVPQVISTSYGSIERRAPPHMPQDCAISTQR